MKCGMCEKGNLKVEKRPFEIYGISLGKFDAEVCSACGEIFYDEKSSEEINKKAKEAGIWGLGSKTNVTRSGNALAVRLSKAIANFAKIRKGEEVFVHPAGKRKIVIELPA